MKVTILNDVRPGFYLDSVALMRISRTVADMDGVEEAALMMGSPSNKEIMKNAGLLEVASEEAGGGDLIIGIRAVSRDVADEALGAAILLLDKPAGRTASGGRSEWHPRTLRAAMNAARDHQLVLISVPGDFAVAEARKAIHAGRHPMIFSDNVALEDEVSLKQEARELGCLVMGPDCGTAIINGTPLAFANKMPTGDIGIIGASGTGIQEVTCLIARGGKGISHAIGVGGRDLKDAVGGISTLMALDALDQDPNTAHIVIISKPPSATVARTVLDRVATSRKTFTICFVGARDIALPKNARLATTLKAAAVDALGSDAFVEGFDQSEIVRPLQEDRRLVRGLYTGGTLCAEAQVLFGLANECVSSNAPIPGVPQLDKKGNGHLLIDLGDDEYTRGKPHPMIDPSVRFDALHKALGDPRVGVVLLDVVIGFGAHDDPAGQLAEQLAGRSDHGPLIIASVTGTEEDPQVRSRQVSRLARAGIAVAPSNADAVAVALACLKGAGRVVSHAAK
jgi:succinyl-CoA synthetase alpha subunit